MANPFTFRPEYPDWPEDAEPNVDWEDNWLSNAMAYFSQRLVPIWCDSPEHWTSRMTGYLWTSCPCCLTFRGLIVGFVIGIAIGAIVTGLLSATI